MTLTLLLNMSCFPLSHSVSLYPLLFLHLSMSPEPVYFSETHTHTHTHTHIHAFTFSHTFLILHPNSLTFLNSRSVSSSLLSPLMHFELSPLDFITQTAPSGNYDQPWNAKHTHSHTHTHTLMHLHNPISSCPLLQVHVTLVPVGHERLWKI